MQRGWMRTEWTCSQAASPSARRALRAGICWAELKPPTPKMSRKTGTATATRVRDMVSLWRRIESLSSAKGKNQRTIDTARARMVLLGVPSGATMPNDMGTFRVDIELENPAKPGIKRTLSAVLEDTGAELSWVPAEVLESLGVERNNLWRFRQANGTVLERWTGIVVIAVAGKRTGDDVVFGEPGDLTLLGSRTLEGLNFRVEPVTKQLVDAGPAPAAALADGSILSSLF